MSITKRNFFRVFLCLTLVFATLVGTTSVAHAQIGTPNEVWTSSDQSGHVTMHDTNLTPVKTMGRSGTLALWFAFTKADDGPPIKLRIQVRNLTQNRNYDFVTYHYPASIEERFPHPDIWVNQGDRLQIYFDICTEDGYARPGYTRSAVVQYGYNFK